MAESQQEQKVMVAALKREINEYESVVKSLRGELADLAKIAGTDLRQMKMQLRIQELEKQAEKAVEQLANRVGLPKRPGRPPQNPSNQG